VNLPSPARGRLSISPEAAELVRLRGEPIYLEAPAAFRGG
jgi:hypothetical protein